MAIRMKSFQNTGRAARRGRIWVVALAVAAGIGLTVGPAPVSAEKTQPKTGKTLSGNYLAGIHAQARRDLSAAADFLGAALNKAPSSASLVRRTFVLMIVEGRIREAESLARQLIAQDPNASVAQLTLAAIAIKQGRFQEAEKRLGEIPAKGLSGFVAPALRACATSCSSGCCE